MLKIFSDTGNRTPICWVKTNYTKPLYYIGGWTWKESNFRHSNQRRVSYHWTTDPILNYLVNIGTLFICFLGSAVHHPI